MRDDSLLQSRIHEEEAWEEYPRCSDFGASFFQVSLMDSR
jgi:hypothetical protein